MTIESSEIVETANLGTKFSNFSCDIKPLKMFEDISSNVVLDNTKVLGNLRQYPWLVTPMKPLRNGFMKVSHDGPRLS